MSNARYRIVKGEALAVMRSMGDASVDAVITDPPYSSGGFTRGDRIARVSDKYTGTDVRTERPDFAGGQPRPARLSCVVHAVDG